MTSKDPIRKAFERYVTYNGEIPNLAKRYNKNGYLYREPSIKWEAFQAALSLIPHAAEILSGEAEVVLKGTKP